MFTCSNCGNPFEHPPLVSYVRFPEDVNAVMDVLEGRFNSVNCQICKQLNTILDVVLAVDLDGKQILAVAPEYIDPKTLDFSKATNAGLQVLTLHNYEELRRALIGKLDRYVVPVGRAVILREIELPQEQLIELVSPFFLRLFKSSTEGWLPPLVHLSGDLDEKKKQEILSGFYIALLCDHMQRIVNELAGRAELLTLPKELGTRIPAECLTEKVLQEVARKCPGYVSPYEDPKGFSDAYLQEYLNATTHWVASKVNPRGWSMATFVSTAWNLRDSGVQIDEQFVLNPEIVQHIVRFEDLWDVNARLFKSGGLPPTDIKKLTSMLEYYGFDRALIETLGSGALWIDPNELAESTKAEKLLTSLKASLQRLIQLGVDRERSENAGVPVGSGMRIFLRNGAQALATQLMTAMIEEARVAGDVVAAVSITAHAADEFNSFNLYDDARQLLTGILESIRDQKQFSPTFLAYCWNIFGNTLRYMHQYEGSLDAYEFAVRVAEFESDTLRKKSDLQVIRRNIGLVYRDMGKWHKALPLLREAADLDPVDHATQHSLAIFFQKLNRNREALTHLNRAIELARGQVHDPVRSTYLISRALVLRDLGELTAGMEDLKAAFELAPTDSMKARAAVAALSFPKVPADMRDFFEQSRQYASEQMDRSTGQQSLLSLLYYQLAEVLIREKKYREANALLRPYVEQRQRENADLPWQFSLAMAEICRALGHYKESWQHLHDAWRAIESKVPTAEEVEYAPSWLLDKGDFQNRLTQICLELVEKDHLSSDVLASAYEFNNGREIRARLLGSLTSLPQSIEQTLESYRQKIRAPITKCQLFFMLEDEDQVRLVHISTEGRAEVLGVTMHLDAVLLARDAFRSALRRLNPADPSSTDPLFRPWADVAFRLGTAVAPYLSENSHIVFLPGRVLTGLPLHLLPISPREVLLDRHDVSYAPNFTSFLAGAANKHRIADEEFAIVTVTAEKDKHPFVSRAFDASERIQAMLAQHSSVVALKQESADHEAVIGAMSMATEIVFLCHGTTAGLEGGYGICLAHKQTLPPRILSVEEFPDQTCFILSWKDIDRSPSVVCSIACSTGLSQISGGGVRFGLEQSMFSAGTSAIVSPLWDVEQQSSLRWMETFYRQRFSHPDWTISRAHRQTCLEVREFYPHFYFWAPFVVNGFPL